MTGSQVVKQKQTFISNEEKFKESIEKAKEIASKMEDRIAAAAFLKNVTYLVEIGDPQAEWFVSAREIVVNNPDKSKPQEEDGDYYSF